MSDTNNRSEVYAFPTDGNAYFQPQRGMTLRDWFAGQVLLGMITSKIVGYTRQTKAELAYEYADCMLRAREQTASGR